VRSRVARSRGFTLLEAVVAIVLLGLLASVGTNMMSDTMIASFTTTQNHSSGSQLRFAVERMAREIREMAYAATGYDITTKTSTSLVFKKEDGTTVSISASANTVTMAYGATSSTLTDQLSTGGLSLTYLDQLGAATTDNDEIRFVQISMTVANTKTGKTDSLRTRVMLREAQASP
jgi:prepilin-type N-terminal cleavage/methylation domain-containing protein